MPRNKPSPDEIASIQEPIVDDIKRQRPLTSKDEAMAGAIGASRSKLTAIRQGETRLDVVDLAGWIKEYGAVAALGHLANLDNCDVVKRTGPTTTGREVLTNARRSGNRTVAMFEDLLDENGDGGVEVTPAEAAAAVAGARETTERMQRALAFLEERAREAS